ncbi:MULTISPECIES: ribosome assembly RNA-binding protein YhbY [Carboxydocella]|uniref:RNA-binding protein n=2 Tax=Carboxydocella TaxID=178898 RepID=A0A1T4L4I7_9FIRM|nr:MULTISPECIES: ribosome assembly RNA-binding protein YhbY [Carboxydocella]AVX19969.1 RNA-binding protein [Carboxydocella thermautotrophica]AVX30391.1 RNA-binding protein [Carboxydocella thermautotrophica]SJZ49642.1 RNA-binding protein [Carboxydocella sporoproducens DSM 16521]GAW28024.1 RNA-binding protein [Carboxydocella sp. ULO1]GAW32342.1 RNA-binding protein [Carboxydocella sp. JDF658]
MVLTGKQKRYLRGLGSLEPVTVQIGKGGVTPTVIQQLDETLEARELVKVRVLKNCLEEKEDIARRLAEGTGAELVQMIGHNLLFYRPAQKPQIQLPG